MVSTRRVLPIIIAVAIVAAAVAGGSIAFRAGKDASGHRSADTPTTAVARSVQPTAQPSPSASPPGTATAMPSDSPIATPSRTPLPPGKKGTPRGAATSLPKKVDKTKASDVAEMFAINAELWDTYLDHRPNDSSARAAAWASPTLRKKMLTSAPLAAPGADWDNLVAQHGYTTVKIRFGGIGNPPPDTATTAYRAIQIANQTEHSDHGWSHTGPDQGTLYIVTLHRLGPGKAWAVSNFTIQ